MYKLLLCLRYLRTRWIALASVVSMTLGVATLIVVNSVMGGFATEMRDRIHGILADIMIQGDANDGFPNADMYMANIRNKFGDKIAAMTPVIETLGFLTFSVGDQSTHEWVEVMGIDINTHGTVGRFNECMVDPSNRERPTFEIRESVRAAARSRPWWLSDPALMPHDDFPRPDTDEDSLPKQSSSIQLGTPQEDDAGSAVLSVSQSDAAVGPEQSPPDNPFRQNDRESLLGPSPEVQVKERGIVVPWLLASFRRNERDIEIIRPGEKVMVTMPSSSVTSFKIVGVHEQFTVVDRFKSGMSEYDQRFCYVDIKDLQEIRGMGNNVSAIHIKLKDYSDSKIVVAGLREMFPAGLFHVQTWEQKQGPLLSAVAVEQGILNVLLFMIIAVAGFGILAIFFMIVVEKTRDIGILKALGASDHGIQQIFLGYGLGLGLVGSGFGMGLGLLIVVYLDKIEKWLSWLSGRHIFDPNLYYFDRIPTVIEWSNITWIVFGAMLIALAASVLPARRAAALQPVQALRYE